ncbi:reverse transcriptase, partial [Globisporangium splendens]
MTGTSLAKHLQESERSKTEFKTDRSGQIDSEPVAENPMENSDNSSLGELMWTPPLDEREKFEPNQLSGSHGWSFASQENQPRHRNETRITTSKEERRLRHYWNRIWGVTNLDKPTSFWSIHSDATGGVAILTNPKTISETQLIEESKWTNRTVAIKSEGVVRINVYASNKKSEREHFFRRLNEEFGTHRAAAVLGGDFNCVLKQRDRYQRGVLLPVQSGQRHAMGGHRATQALLGPPSSGAAYEMDESTAETKEGEQVQAIAHELELMQSEGPIEWSHLEQRIARAILRLEDQQHQPANRTRRQLIEEQANAAREAAEFKFADVMGAEWHQITGQSHATVPPHKAEQRFGALMYIPESRKVTEAQNQDLMAPITDKEVREAIAALHRHKIIGEAQQGFVGDRLMENAILIMQAALGKAYHNNAEGLDGAPGIAMLDFMKAYDTLDRDFLHLVLSKFGFGRQFVDLHYVRRSILDPMSPENVIMLPGIIAEGRKLRGTFCAEWLPYMTSTADGWLLDSNGSPYKLAHTSLSVGTAQLGDILRWEWIRPGVLNFIPTCGISGFSRPSIRALERLCATLVSNFPQLLYRPQQTNVLRLYNGQRHYNHEWHLHTSEATLTHVDTTLVKATHTVHSATDCDIMATRDLNGQKVSFHAHPRFTRIVQLWGGNGRYNTARSFYRQQVAATRTQIGKDTRDAAVNKAVHTAGSLDYSLYSQTLLRLKANRLSMWNYEKADLSCSNPECSQVVQSSVQHLLWECPKAKLVWNYFYALWAKIGITPGHDPAIWIFSLDLPDTPRHAWTTIKRHIIGHKFSNEHLQDHLYSVAHMLRRYVSASLIHAIWCAHLRRMDSDPIKSTAEMAVMMTRLEAGMRNLTRLAEAQAGDSDGHTVAAVLKAYVDCFLSQTDAIPLTPSDTRGVYLLFFDGGSRGNPGPGGTGSIIVRVHKDSHTASLIWAASMAYSRKDTTNNFAEYWGLIHGLREAQRSHFEPLYVIGDSALIISQQRMHRSPRQHRLHVYTRQVDDSRIASTSEDGTITTVPSTRWRTQPPT